MANDGSFSEVLADGKINTALPPSDNEVDALRANVDAAARSQLKVPLGPNEQLLIETTQKPKPLGGVATTVTAKHVQNVPLDTALDIMAGPDKK